MMNSEQPISKTIRPADDGLFLPDFCNIRVVFSVVMIAELLAFILALAPIRPAADRWSDLSLISLFVQWVALSTTAVLCLCRPALRRLSQAGAATVCLCLMLLVTLLLSEAAYRIGLGVVSDSAANYTRHLSFLFRNLAISAIVNAVALRYFYLQFQLKNRIEAEARARLQALQARIHPHFLFNSMNTIASLTRSNPALAEEIVEDLADLFRVSLADPNHLVTIGEEIELSRRYLNIEKMRLGERLTVEWDLGDIPLQVKIPALTIQPLLENAIYHGIEPVADPGIVGVSSRKTGKTIEITITNPAPQSLTTNRRKGHHMAIQNIRERLAAHFGDLAKCEMSLDNDRYTTRLIIPCEGEQP